MRVMPVMKVVFVCAIRGSIAGNRFVGCESEAEQVA